MKAARLVGPSQFEIIDADMPSPNDGQCLIKLEKISVCGSDIRHEYSHLFPEDHYPGLIGVPGHECAGVVVESRCQEYVEGQRVIIYPGRGVNSGGLVEYIASGPEWMCALPDEGDLAEWVLCQPSGTVLFSVQQMGSLLGKTVVVVGQGVIGLSFTMLCAKLGAFRLVGIDPIDYRLDWSKKMGATHAFNPDQVDVVEAVEELTGGRGADVVVEAAGYPDSFNTALRLVAQFGKVMVFGIQGDEFIPVQHNLLMERQPELIPTTGGRLREPMAPIRTMVELKRRGWCNPGEMLTHRLPFEEVQRAFEMYENQEDGIIKVVMTI